MPLTNCFDKERSYLTTTRVPSVYGPMVEPSGTIVSFSKDTLRRVQSIWERKSIFFSMQYHHLNVVGPSMDNEVGVLSSKARILRCKIVT